MFFKKIENNTITVIGRFKGITLPLGAVEISEADYNSIKEIVQTKPKDTLESIYRLSAETNQYEAFARTHDETVEWYVQKVTSGEMTIEELPEDYKAEVEAQIPTEPENPYGISDETYNNIIDDYTASLTEEVANNGY